MRKETMENLPKCGEGDDSQGIITSEGGEGKYGSTFKGGDTCTHEGGKPRHYSSKMQFSPHVTDEYKQ